MVLISGNRGLGPALGEHYKADLQDRLPFLQWTYSYVSTSLCRSPGSDCFSKNMLDFIAYSHAQVFVCVCMCVWGGEKQREERDRDTQRETEIDVRCFSQLLSTVIFWETGSH